MQVIAFLQHLHQRKNYRYPSCAKGRSPAETLYRAGKMISFDPKTAFAVLLLSLAAVLIGLLLAALPYLKVPEPDRPKPQWVASIFLFALSLPIFGWLALSIEDYSLPSFALSTVANLLFFLASCLQADFYRSLNSHRRQTDTRWLLPVLVLVYVPLFEWARAGTLDTRIMVSATLWQLAILWQLHELRELRKNNESVNIDYLHAIALAEFVCGVIRILISATNEFQITSFYTITKFHFVFAILQVFLTVLSYFGVSKYWTERTTRQLTTQKLESEKIRELMAEKEKMLLKLLASNKTAASGVLSATVVHEITQPLTALSIRLSNAIRLANDPAHGDAIRAELLECQQSTGRISQVIKTIRLIFAGNTPTFEPVNLKKIAETVATVARTECEAHRIELLCSTRDDVFAVGNAREIQHVIFNFLINAIDALRQDSVTRRQITLIVHGTGSDSHVQVMDTGSGVDPKIEDKLFTLLESSKSEGMGIGLWLCKQIADRHKGSLHYRRNPTGGAVFELVLPRLQS